MFIQEATKKAIEIGGFIARAKWKGAVRVKPTDDPRGCVLFSAEKAPGPHWQPRADDLVADDWEVTTEESI